jgi:hypothetical protein
VARLVDHGDIGGGAPPVAPELRFRHEFISRTVNQFTDDRNALA